MRNIYLSLFLAIILSLSFVSAFEFDNVVKPIEVKDSAITFDNKVVEYKPIWEKYAPIKIDNAFGLGSTLLGGYIDKHTETCGSNCESEFYLKTYEEEALIDDIKFYNVNTGKEVSLDYKVYIKTGEKLVDDYSWSCIKGEKDLIGNGTYQQTCGNYVSGNHLEDVFEEYKLGESRKAEVNKFKIEAIKSPSDSIDWVIKTQGKNLNDWAIWYGDGGVYVEDNQVNTSSNTDGDTTCYGFKFIANKDSTLKTITKLPDAPADITFYVYSGSTLLGSAQVVGQNASFSVNLIDGSTYAIVGGATGRAWNTTQITPPYALVNINITGFAYTSTANCGSAGLTYPAGNFAPHNVKSITTFSLNNLNSLQSAPANGFNTTSSTLDIKCNFTSNNQNISSVKLNVYDSSNNLDYTNTDTLGAGIFSYNKTWTTSSLTDDNYNWACYSYGNLGENASTTNRTFTIGTIEGATIYNASVYEIERQGFSIALNSSKTITSPAFIYDGSTYTATSTNTGLNYTLSSTINVPASAGNKIAYFTYTSASQSYKTTNISQTVNPISFNLCNVTNNVTYLNVTFKDESILANINAEITTSTWVYYLSDISANKTLTFINNSGNSNYQFCFTPSFKSLNTLVSLSYKNSTNYPQRVYTSTLSLTNSTLNKTLYLLSTTAGIYVTFQVLDATNKGLQGVEVNGTRTIDSETVTVAQGTTDGSGGVTFWLNPDFPHYFTFYKSGYDSYSTSLTPTQSTYTITLGGGTSTSQITDYSRGITQTIKPATDFLNKQSVWGFNYTIGTTYWTLDSWGFTLKYLNETIIGTQTSTSDTGGTLNQNANVSNQTKVIMNYFYVVNGTSINGTRFWTISATSDYSLWYFFGRVSNAVDSNLLGISSDDNGQFSKALISVFIIVFCVGGIALRYGIQNEAMIMGVIAGILFFLNTINLLPNVAMFEDAIMSFGDLLVLITAIITIGFIIKEEQS